MLVGFLLPLDYSTLAPDYAMAQLTFSVAILFLETSLQIHTLKLVLLIP